MSVALTDLEYRAACGYAGRWLAGERPELIPAGGPTGESVGVYLLSAPCPQTGRPRVLYVGRADRAHTGGDVADRVSSHLRSSKEPAIAWVTVIPLSKETPAEEIARIEGDIARYFGVPRLCRAVPRRVPVEAVAGA